MCSRSIQCGRGTEANHEESSADAGAASGKRRDGSSIDDGEAGEGGNRRVWRRGINSSDKWAGECGDIRRGGGSRSGEKAAGSGRREDEPTEGVACISLAADGADGRAI